MSKQPLWTPGGAAHWLAHAQAWQQGAAAAGAVVVVGFLIWWPVHLRRRADKRRQELALARAQAGTTAAEDPKNEPLDPFTAFVTLMATFLSVNGMWHVFGETMHLPGPARVVSCSVLEAAGFAFMRLARKDILEKRPATGNVVTVWVIATLSGTLSAGASQSPLEVGLRIAFPLLAVHLCHSWMLPIPTEITLDKLQKGKRAWRYIKANRRLARSSNKLTRWGNQKLLDMESDRLAKRALLAGDDTSAVLREAERASVAEALTALRPVVRESGESAIEGSVVRESEGSVVRESATTGLPESEGPVVRGSVIEGSAGESVVREAEGPQGPWSDGPKSPQGPSVGGSAIVIPESGSPAVAGSEVAGLIPNMRFASKDEAVAAAQATNSYPPAAWSQWEEAIAKAPQADLVREGSASGFRESGIPGVRESEGPQGPWSDGPKSPWINGSEGPWSVVRDGEGPRGREAERSAGSVVRGSEGPQRRESASPLVPESGVSEARESGAEWSDPRWSDETGRLARQVVAEFERDGAAVTREAVLKVVRDRGGSVTNAHRSALYAYARSPQVPAASELEDTIDRPDGIEGLAELLAAKEA